MQRFSMCAKCPYFVTASAVYTKKFTITCENPYEKMGFDVHTQLNFANRSDREDFFQVFCEDRFYACPYFIYVAGTRERELKSRRDGKK